MIRRWFCAGVMLCAPTPLVQAGESGISGCASIDDDATRLACFDALAASIRAEERSTATAATGSDTFTPTDPIVTDAVNAGDSAVASVEPGLARQRMNVESAIADLPWAVLPYHRNYLLPVTWNNNINRDPWENLFPGEGLQNEEAKFQISFKALAVRNILGEGTNLWAAYTQESWWQVYNQDLSSPFRETNYQPELMFTMDNDTSVLGFTNTQLGLSFNHQSNGRS
ncbi:MAG: phospholipase A, partial [Chromatocurvus sp.]